jgi:hypothetical protein
MRSSRALASRVQAEELNQRLRVHKAFHHFLSIRPGNA